MMTVKTEYNRLYQRQRRQDPMVRVVEDLTERIRLSLRGFPDMGTMQSYIGCSLDELKQYLEKQFAPDMSWKNYGRKWEVFVAPCNSVELDDWDDQRSSFKYDNMQPVYVSAVRRRKVND